MTPTPTNLPPSVAELRKKIMDMARAIGMPSHTWTSLDQLCALAARAADSLDPEREARVVHLSSDMHPEFVGCGIPTTPAVKRTPRVMEATCVTCLQIDAAAGDDDQPLPVQIGPVLAELAALEHTARGQANRELSQAIVACVTNIRAALAATEPGAREGE